MADLVFPDPGTPYTSFPWTDANGKNWLYDSAKNRWTPSHSRIVNGLRGATGQGVPAGGTTSQVLAKSSNTDYDTAWADPAAGSGTVTSVSVVTANGISGSVANATTTPAITITLDAITPTSVNGLTLAAAATGFTIAGGTTSKTLTVSNTLTLSGTDGATLNIGAGGTLGTAAFTAATAYLAVAGTAADVNPAGTSIAAALSAKAPSSHTHAVADISATGTPSASTWLRGDAAWQSLPNLTELNTAGLTTGKFILTTGGNYIIHSGTTGWDGDVTLPTHVNGNPGAVIIANNHATDAVVKETSGSTLATIDVGTWMFVIGTDGAWKAINLTLDTDLSSTSANDDTIPSAKAAKAMGDLKVAKATMPWELAVAAGDETTAITTTGQKLSFRMPYAMRATSIYVSLVTAPSVQAVTVDLEDGGTSVLNAVVSVGTSNFYASTSTFAGSAAYYDFAANDLVSVDVDQADTAGAAAGLKLHIIGTRDVS